MNRQTITEIKRLLTENQIDDDMMHALRNDSRKGVQRLLTSYERKQAQKQAMLEAQEVKRGFDRQFTVGNTWLAGVDEAGRGPLAGPVTAAAVILPENFSLPGLTDSKQLTENERQRFNQIIRNEAIACHVAVIEREVIDKVNIYEATKLAMQEAINALNVKPGVVLVDAVELDVPGTQTKAIIKGDDYSLAIAAASILAKVKRDELMTEIDETYPVYEFKKNKGYGTNAHLSALKMHGPCPCHRRSFAPVLAMSEGGTSNGYDFKNTRNIRTI